jgi:hypothetical protein
VYLPGGFSELFGGGGGIAAGLSEPAVQFMLNNQSIDIYGMTIGRHAR